MTGHTDGALRRQAVATPAFCEWEIAYRLLPPTG
jgi:hypothetical protein